MEKTAHGAGFVGPLDRDASEPVRLTAEQAQALRDRQPGLSPWWVVGMQALLGVLLFVVVWWVSGSRPLAVSTGYGALSVVIPAALAARGMTSRLWRLSPANAVMGFFVWEMTKLAASFAMLVMAPTIVVGLSWPALLLGLVVTMKVYWVALLVQPRGKKAPSRVG
jgi:ATP synthase protein I